MYTCAYIYIGFIPLNPSCCCCFVAGVWVYMTLLPTLILNAERSDRPLGKRDYLGWGIWALGFLIETVADYQKSCFKADPANKVRKPSRGWCREFQGKQLISLRCSRSGDLYIWFVVCFTQSCFLLLIQGTDLKIQSFASCTPDMECQVSSAILMRCHVLCHRHLMVWLVSYSWHVIFFVSLAWGAMSGVTNM